VALRRSPPFPIFEQFVKQILAFVAILVTAAVSARSFPFAFTASARSLWFLAFCFGFDRDS
jgi:hypothetical protein